MSKSMVRAAVVVLTLFTALIHLVVLNLDGLEILFLLNGLGYLGLLGALLFNVPAGQQRLIHYAFMAYAVVTITAWVIMNGDFTDPIGVSTKTVEVLLIVFLWLDLQRNPS